MDLDNLSNVENEDRNQKELQNRLCFIREQLQAMICELPSRMQQRIPNGLVSSLAESLVDNTVYGIVTHLMDIQHYAEKKLFAKRLVLMRKHTAVCNKIKKFSMPDASRKKLLKELHEKYRMKYIEFDKTVLKALDEKKREQQGILVMAEVPGFEVTDDRKKIQIQVNLIKFILRIGEMVGNNGGTVDEQ